MQWSNTRLSVRRKEDSRSPPRFKPTHQTIPPGPPPASMPGARNSSDRVLLNYPPGLPDIGLMAALVADVALLPVTPSPLDVIASKKALQLMRAAQGSARTAGP